MCTSKHYTVDLSECAGKILADEDRPLFDEAVGAAKAGAVRAAYVMIWLTCVESLKRRFREAQKRDSDAGRIVGDIEKIEGERKSVDNFVLQKAHKYGFLSDAGYEALSYVYKMRCIYAHPYEEAPSPGEVAHAAEVVVEHVLSKPVKLRHGFANQLLINLLRNPSYLDDYERAVTAFAKDIISKLDEKIHNWFLDKYWEGLEKLAFDPSAEVLFRRGIWFTRTMLIELGTEILSHDQWHDRVARFPKTLMHVCSIPDIFRGIGERAQDTLIGSIIDQSNIYPTTLRLLESLDDQNALSERQKERFNNCVSKLSLDKLRSASLRTRTCFRLLIDALKSYNWYAQNPAIDMIVSNGPTQAAELTVDQQVELGRNVLQAAEGQANSAVQFLERLAEDISSWPFNIVRGIALETFTNEKNEIRFKHRNLDKVLYVLDHLDKNQRKQIVVEIVESIDIGIPKSWVYKEDFKMVINSLMTYRWAHPLVLALEAKGASIPSIEEIE